VHREKLGAPLSIAGLLIVVIAVHPNQEEVP